MTRNMLTIAIVAVVATACAVQADVHVKKKTRTLTPDTPKQLKRPTAKADRGSTAVTPEVQVSVQVRLVQFNLQRIFEIKWDDERCSDESITWLPLEHTPNSDGEDVFVHSYQQDFSRILLVAKDAKIGLGAAVMTMRDGSVSGELSGKLCHPVAVPRLVAVVGQEAEFSIGRAVPYMVQCEDGSLVVKRAADCQEGLTMKMRVVAADLNAVVIGKMDVNVNSVRSREEIPGVPFDVGIPVIVSQQSSLEDPLRLGIGEAAIIPVEQTPERPECLISPESSALYLFVTAAPVSR